MRLVFAGLLSVGIVAIAAANPRDFTISVKPIFESSFSWANAPVAVDIENKGPDAVGQLLATGEEKSTRYPIELPTGAKKRVVAYPSGSAYGMPPELFLDTDQARIQIPFLSKGSYVYGGMSLVALISDNSGELGFLRQGVDTNPNNSQNTFGDAYCLPEDAPERPVGYQGLSAIVLGEGSDRISDAAVRAIQSYATTGGTVIFVGGASARVLSDPRWAGFLPGSGFLTTNVKGSRVLSHIQGVAFTEAMTISSGKPEPFAKVQKDGETPMILERGYGLGRVVVLAFNPFEEPLVRWAGRRRLFNQYARGLESQSAAQFLMQFDTTNSSSYDPYGESYGYPVHPSGVYSTTNPSGQSDPFSVELPGASKVFWILAAFFVTVVPVNFLVLRKLGKGEWAWVTAPVISLAFAGIFLNQASDLYSASLSTATNGALVVQQDNPEAMFIGSTQMFFPNGGSYDLKMENVDQLGSGQQEYYGYYGGASQSRTQVNPVDTGSIRIPDLRAANLAFEQIGYRQKFSQFPKIQILSEKLPNGLAKVTVKNTSSTDLRNAAVIVAGLRHGLKPLKPGEEQTLQTPSEPSAQHPRNNSPAGSSQAGSDFLEGLTIRQPVIALVSDIDGLQAGPQIGAMVAGRSNTRLIHIAPLPTREETR